MANSPQQQTSKVYLTSLQVMHIAFLVGQLIFMGISFYLQKSGNFGTEATELVPTFKIIVPVFALVAIVGSNFLFNLKIKATPKTSTLSEKLVSYRMAFISKLAVLEGASFFSIVSYLLTQNVLFLSIATLLVVLFVLQRPTVQKIVEVFQLSNQEKQLLEKPDSIVIK